MRLSCITTYRNCVSQELSVGRYLKNIEFDGNVSEHNSTYYDYFCFKNAVEKCRQTETTLWLQNAVGQIIKCRREPRPCKLAYNNIIYYLRVFYTQVIIIIHWLCRIDNALCTTTVAAGAAAGPAANKSYDLRRITRPDHLVGKIATKRRA